MAVETEVVERDPKAEETVRRLHVSYEIAKAAHKAALDRLHKRSSPENEFGVAETWRERKRIVLALRALGEKVRDLYLGE